LLGQHLLPAIRSVAGNFFTFQQDNAPARATGEFLSRNTPDFISPLPWPPNSPDLNRVDYQVWGVLEQRVYRSRIRDVDHLKQRLIEEWRCFDQNIIDRALSSSTVACSTTRMRPCKRRPLWAQTVTDIFGVRTAKATFPYWKLLFFSSIFRTAVAQKLCTGFCWNLQRLRRKDDN